MKLLLFVILGFLMLPFIVVGFVFLIPPIIVGNCLQTEALESLMGPNFKYMPQKPHNAW